MPGQYAAPVIIVSSNEDGKLCAAVTNIRYKERWKRNQISIPFETKSADLVHDIDALRELYETTQVELDRVLKASVDSPPKIIHDDDPFMANRYELRQPNERSGPCYDSEDYMDDSEDSEDSDDSDDSDK